MKTTRSRLSLPFVLFLAGCPAAPPPPEVKTVTNAAAEDPCRGARLELHQVEKRCTVKIKSPVLPPAGLTPSLVPSPVAVVTGQQGEVVVRFTNSTGAPLKAVIPRGCAAFTTSIVNSEGKAVDEEGDTLGMLGMLCGTPPPVVVTLEPGGHIDVKVPVSARKRRWVTQGNASVAEPGSPISPGTYTLKVQSPYSDMVDGDPQHRRSRWVKAPLHVVK